MTDEQVRNLKPGDRIRSGYFGTRAQTETVAEIRFRGTCVNEHSKCFSHQFVGIIVPFGDHATMSHSIESDEYIHGEGYRTHDANGVRIGGYELIEG